MDMCYDGALVMPSNYALMSEEEMTYVEGGSLNTLKKNLRGLAGVVRDYVCRWSACATVGRVLQSMGLSVGQIASIAGGYWSLVGKITSIVTSVTKWLGAHWVAIGILTSVGATALLWNCRVFY